MEQFTEGESTREEIKNKLRQNFDGKIVRKDLTKKIKERWHSDYEGLHGIRLFCPWQRRKSCCCVHGICGKYQSECGRAVENIQSVCTFPAGNGNRYSIS